MTGDAASRADSGAIERTGELLSRARRILAYGGLDGVIHRPLVDEDGTPFPHFAVRADGYEIVDSTGRTYVDWANGWGPVFLGYRHPEVEAAIREQLEAGPTLSLMHPVEVEVATMLTEMIPCAEMVAFGKNGSDAIAGALRIARAATDREVILQHGFHGFHEWYVCLHPGVRGIPKVMKSLVHPFPYNDLRALESLFSKLEGQVAAVIMEPMNTHFPNPGYLEGVRDLTKKHGALLIFDEIVTAFRLAPGGAQEHFGVTPDLACIGKAMANGMPLSAVVGRRQYMQFLPSVGYGMTFRGETLSLAAARAVLKVLRREPVVAHLSRIGTEIRNGFDGLCRKHGVRCELLGPPSRMTFGFAPAGAFPLESLRSLFLIECLRRGVMTNGTLLATYAHDSAAVRRTLGVFDDALAVVAAAVREGGTREPRPAGGSPFGPRTFLANGFIEVMDEEADALRIGGWMLVDDGVPDAIELESKSGAVITAARVERPDLATGFARIPDARWAGYSARLPSDAFKSDDGYEFTIAARRGGRIRFRCRVWRRSSASSAGPYWTGDGVLHV